MSWASGSGHSTSPLWIITTSPSAGTVASPQEPCSLQLQFGLSRHYLCSPRRAPLRGRFICRKHLVVTPQCAWQKKYFVSLTHWCSKTFSLSAPSLRLTKLCQMLHPRVAQCCKPVWAASGAANATPSRCHPAQPVCCFKAKPHSAQLGWPCGRHSNDRNLACPFAQNLGASS